VRRVLTNLRDRFFGRGAYSITVPPMDGVLRPNEWLEAAPVLAELPAPDQLHADAAGTLWLASGASLVRLQGSSAKPERQAGAAVWDGLQGANRSHSRRYGEDLQHSRPPETADARGAVGFAELPQGTSSVVVQSFAADITAFARAADGRQGVATLDGALHLPVPVRNLPQGMLRQCITGLAFDPDGGCFLTVGSTHNPANAWQQDLLERRTSGSLWHVSAAGDARMVADGLAWPQSPLADAHGVLLSESSASRVLRIAPSGQRDVMLTNLPGYPAGLARTSQGYALCIKAPRGQLIEFILREPEFCAQMIREIAPPLWIAPALYPAQSFQEPLQGGALKQLGIMKPWAPTRSYGLVIELDEQFLPLRSHHSRANGTRHGTVSCAVVDGQLAVASIGAGCVLALRLHEGEPA